MNTDTLIEKVQLVIQDSSFDEDTILGFLNKGLNEIAGSIDLPELRVFDTVDTSTTDNFVAMPTNYQRKCFTVVSVSDEVRVDSPGELYQYHRFIDRHPVADTGSSVSDVAINGNTLFYDPIPDSAETLRVEYLRAPTTLTSSGEPDGIPTHLHESLLVPFAAKEIFNLIEDGVEGQKVNTQMNEGLYRRAMQDLHQFVGYMDSEPNYIADDFL